MRMVPDDPLVSVQTSLCKRRQTLYPFLREAVSHPFIMIKRLTMLIHKRETPQCINLVQVKRIQMIIRPIWRKVIPISLSQSVAAHSASRKSRSRVRSRSSYSMKRSSYCRIYPLQNPKKPFAWLAARKKLMPSTMPLMSNAVSNTYLSERPNSWLMESCKAIMHQCLHMVRQALARRIQCWAPRTNPESWCYLLKNFSDR